MCIARTPTRPFARDRAPRRSMYTVEALVRRGMPTTSWLNSRGTPPHGTARRRSRVIQRNSRLMIFLTMDTVLRRSMCRAGALEGAGCPGPLGSPPNSRRYCLGLVVRRRFVNLGFGLCILDWGGQVTISLIALVLLSAVIASSQVVGGAVPPASCAWWHLCRVFLFRWSRLRSTSARIQANPRLRRVFERMFIETRLGE